MPQNDFSSSALLATSWRHGLRMAQEMSPMAHPVALRALATAKHWQHSLRACALDAAIGCELVGGLRLLPELFGRIGDHWRQLKGSVEAVGVHLGST